MNNAFLALTAAGLASFGGFGIGDKATPVQTAQVVTVAPDYGQEAGIFSEWLNPNAPQCVAVSKIGSVSHLKKLKPGRYTLVITATNSAGQKSSTQTLTFTIVK